MSNLLSSKLKACTPQYYKLVWDGKYNEPIRHKINSPNLAIEILNNIWIEILEKYTGSISIPCEKYTRLNVNCEKDTIAILVYPNGTIMYQGNTVVSWADSHLENISKQVQLEIKNKEPDIVKDSDKDLHSKSPTNSPSNNELPNSSQISFNKPTTLEPLDLSISNKDSSLHIQTDSPDHNEQINKSSTSEPLDSSSSLDFSEMNSFLDSSKSSISPILKSAEVMNDDENRFNTFPFIETDKQQQRTLALSSLSDSSKSKVLDQSSLKDHDEQIDETVENLIKSPLSNNCTGLPIQTTPNVPSKETCKRSLNFDNPRELQDVTLSNQRYPARLSITPDPQSSILSSHDSFRSMIPLSGVVTMSPCTRKSPEHLSSEYQLDSEISVHTRNEDMIKEIQTLKQEKSQLELQIKSLTEKLKYHEDTTAILQNISKQKTERHRLEHRSPNIVIKEFGKMEDVLKETRQKLYDSIEEKKQLNQQILLLKKSNQLNLDMNRNPQFSKLKSDYDRLCGRHEILEVKYETECKSYNSTVTNLQEECKNLNIELKIEKQTNSNMQDALDLANEKIEDMSTAQQRLYDNISELKQTVMLLQKEITNTRSSINNSVDSSSDIDERFIPVLRSPRRKTKSNYKPNQRNADNQSHQVKNQTENSEQINKISGEPTPNNRNSHQGIRQQQFSHGGENQQFQEINGYQQSNTNDKSFWIRGDQQPNWERDQQPTRNPEYENDQNFIPVVQNTGRNQQSLSNSDYENEQNYIPVIQNRGRNTKRNYNAKKYSHPICPFLRNNNYCPSERCVYFHPRKYSNNGRERNNQYQYNSNGRYSNRESQTHQNQRYDTRNTTCKFYLQNRCLYGRNCNYKHPGEIQHP